MLEVELKQEKEVIQALGEKIAVYFELKAMTEMLNDCFYVEETSKKLVYEVNRIFSSPEAIVILYLISPKTGELGIAISVSDQNPVNLKAKSGDFFDQWVARTMQPLLVEDMHSDYRFDVDRIVSEDNRVVRSLISVPLQIGTKVLGILRIDHPREKFFHTEDLRILTAVGDLGAVALENAQLYEQVEQLAIKDSLTDLYLTRYLHSRLPEELSRQLRHHGELSLMMVDLDLFKDYNDRFGHIAGDVVLKTVANILKEFFGQPGNLICRYGGEEFCVVLPDCSKNQALELAEKFRIRISEEIILLRREQTKITVSVGVAAFPVDAHRKEELIHKADSALYEAKSAGRNKVCSA